jgi:alpha-L-fucosidase
MELADYEEMAKTFDPNGFDAEEWVKLAADAGQKMLLITSKHHDGFCLFDSKLTEYKITNSAFRRDPMKELSEACEKLGVALHFYYSLVDWHHPSYLHDWEDYLEYYHGQVGELCTQYGRLGGILFDGCWPTSKRLNEPRYRHFRPGGDWEFGRLYDAIHSLQPDCVITNNTHIAPLPGEDYQVFELDLPGENTAEFNTTLLSELPLASWITMNDHWCYTKDDRNFKSVGHLTELLLSAVGSRAVLFLNIGPDGSGRIQEEEKRRLSRIGRWLKTNSEAIYATVPLENITVSWGHIVQKENKVYLYLVHYPGPKITLDGLPISPNSARFMDGTALKIEEKRGQVNLYMPAAAHNPGGTIIEIA